MSIRAQAELLEQIRNGEITWEQVAAATERRITTYREAARETREEVSDAIGESTQAVIQAIRQRLTELQDIHRELTQNEQDEIQNAQQRRLELQQKTVNLTASLKQAEDGLQKQCQEIQAATKSVKLVTEELRSTEKTNARALKFIELCGENLCRFH